MERWNMEVRRLGSPAASSMADIFLAAGFPAADAETSLAFSWSALGFSLLAFFFFVHASTLFLLSTQATATLKDVSPAPVAAAGASWYGSSGVEQVTPGRNEQWKALRWYCAASLPPFLSFVAVF